MKLWEEFIENLEKIENSDEINPIDLLIYLELYLNVIITRYGEKNKRSELKKTNLDKLTSMREIFSNYLNLKNKSNVDQNELEKNLSYVKEVIGILKKFVSNIISDISKMPNSEEDIKILERFEVLIDRLKTQMGIQD
jgi:hypothetical protein